MVVLLWFTVLLIDYNRNGTPLTAHPDMYVRDIVTKTEENSTEKKKRKDLLAQPARKLKSLGKRMPSVTNHMELISSLVLKTTQFEASEDKLD